MFKVLLSLKDVWKKRKAAKPETSNSELPISPEATMTLTLWLADAAGLRLRVEEISEVLFRLGQEKGYQTSHLAMRRLAGGEVFSEDVAEWAEKLRLLGYTWNCLGDPIGLSERGLIACRKVFEDECRKVLEDERAPNRERQNILPLAGAILELLQKYKPR